MGGLSMETEQARRVQVGDVAIYRRARHRIVAVYSDGFWAPYFELDGAGVVGHALVDSVEISPLHPLSPARGPRLSRGALGTPELGILP